MAVLACSVIQHSFRLLTSRHEPTACACATAVHTVFDTAGARARPAVATAPSNGCDRSADEHPLMAVAADHHFDVSGLSIRAIQTFLSVQGHTETWTVSVQIANPNSAHDRSFSQLKLSLAHSPQHSATALPQLLTHSHSITQLSPGQTVCLSIQLHGASLPTTSSATRLAVGLSWLQSKHAVEAHVIASLTLPRWAAHGQQQLLLHPDAAFTSIDLPQPLLCQQPAISNTLLVVSCVHDKLAASKLTFICLCHCMLHLLSRCRSGPLPGSESEV